MLYRATGTFKKSYEEDLAVYKVPLPKWTMIIITSLVFVIIPLFASEYLLSILCFIGIGKYRPNIVLRCRIRRG